MIEFPAMFAGKLVYINFKLFMGLKPVVVG